MTNVTVWNEHRHERLHAAVTAVYPEGIHMVLAEALRAAGLQVRTATLDEPEHGLTEAVLADTDVLTWWGHIAHDEVADAVVERVQARVLDGMGLIVLHSGHDSKIFRRLTGTTASLVWREADCGERERLWVVNPAHPIAAGLGACIEVPRSEMYGEPFDIPEPDELVFLSWFQGGEVFRSGCCFRRGRGRVFYFSPGHEAFPIYRDAAIQHVVANAARWAAAPHPAGARPAIVNRRTPLEPDAPAQSDQSDDRH